MARGYPDYLAPNTQVSTVQFDGADIIGALGGVLSIDGRGRIVYADAFKSGINSWVLSEGGDGVIPGIVLSDETSYYEGGGVLLSVPVHSASSTMHRTFGGIHGGRYGLEVGVYLKENNASFMLDVTQYINNGSFYSVVLMVSQDDEKIYIQDENGLNVEVYNFSPSSVIDEGWYRLKLVWDTDTGKYVRFMMGTLETDLSDTSMLFDVEGRKNRMQVNMYAYTTTGKFGAVGLGYVIITGDEP